MSGPVGIAGDQLRAIEDAHFRTIPITMAEQIADQLARFGKVSRVTNSS